MIEPVLAEFAQERRMASCTGVRILFRDGQPIRTFVGARPKSRVLADLDDALDASRG